MSKELEFIPDNLVEAYKKSQLHFSRLITDIQNGEETKKRLEEELRKLNDTVVSQRAALKKELEDARKKLADEVKEAKKKIAEEVDQAAAARVDAVAKQKQVADLKKEFEYKLSKLSEANSKAEADNAIRLNAIEKLRSAAQIIQEMMSKI